MNRVRKRIILCLFIFTLVFLSSDVVLAEAGSCGEVRYDITDFNINNEKITIKGWAFISCTQNYTEYNGGDSTIKKTGGGQKIKIRAIDENLETERHHCDGTAVCLRGDLSQLVL